MSRLARMVLPGIPHHVMQCGNRRERTFFKDGDNTLYPDLPTYAALRHAGTIGRPVGSPEWLEGMESRTGPALLPGKRGPKPRSNQGFTHLSP